MRKYILLFFILIVAASLRLYKLDQFPAGLNADEAAIGYNAYSLIQTGMDEYGKAWPLVFRSFDDYKPPVYFYLVVPFVKILGLTVEAVRLPSALLGILSVFLIYELSSLLFKRTEISLLSALVLAISPWHLQFSRGGWEVNAATTFLLLSVIFFLKGLKRSPYWFLSAFFAVVSLYTYHSLRVIIPIFLIGLWLINYKEILPNIRTIVVVVVISTVLLIPLFGQMLSPEGRSRFNGVSIFADQGPLWEALELRSGHQTTVVGKILHNRYLSYTMRLTKNYLSHFSNRFLFINGDEIARSRVPEMGQSLIYFFPFWFIGLYWLFSRSSSSSKIVLLWLFVSPLAAALTFQSPHALRSQNMVIPLSMVTSIGVWYATTLMKRFKTPFLVLIVFLTSFSFGKYLHMYYTHYPQELPYAWQYGFDQIADYVKQNENKYDHIVITDRYDQPYILTAFFLRYPPEKLQKEIVLTSRDKFGFGTVRGFGKFEFHKIDHGKDLSRPRTLVISSDEYVPGGYIRHQFPDPGGKIMYKASDNL